MITRTVQKFSSWLNLTNSTAIITGAARGIGATISESLYQQGCNVLLADIHNVNLHSTIITIRNKNPQLHPKPILEPIYCDVTNYMSVKNLIKRADDIASCSMDRKKAANILIHCAGITNDSMIQDLSEEQFDTVMNVNVKGSFFVSREFVSRDRMELLLMDATKDNHSTGASIIHIGSVVSKQGSIGQVNYACSKGAISGMVKSLAKEMAFHSLRMMNNANKSINYLSHERPTIRVNAILPGFIETDMTESLPEKLKRRVIQKIALGRIGQTQDVANLALFLASERSGYVTGELYECSGMISL